MSGSSPQPGRPAAKMPPPFRGLQGLGRRRVPPLLAILLPVALLLDAAPVLPPGLRVAQADEGTCLNLAQDANRMLAEAEVLANQGQVEKSKSAALRTLDLLERALPLCPYSREMCGQGVIAGVYAEDYPRARAWLDRHIARTPYGERDPEVHYLRALVDLRLVGRADLAVRGLERMQALAPHLHAAQRDTLYYDALLQWGAQLRGQGRHEEALRQFQAAVLVARRTNRPSKERRARSNAGLTLGRARRYEEAADVFQRLLTEEPKNPIWAYQLGINLACQLRFQDATQAYRTSIANQAAWQDVPENLTELSRAHLRLGNCLKLWSAQEPDPAARERRLAEAQKELEAFRAAQPADALGHLWLGVLLFEEREDWHAAVQLFEQALRLDPVCEGTLRYLIRARVRAGGPKAAPGAAPDAQALAAWQAETARLERELEEKKAERDAVLKARTAATGDEDSGCK